MAISNSLVTSHCFSANFARNKILRATSCILRATLWWKIKIRI